MATTCASPAPSPPPSLRAILPPSPPSPAPPLPPCRRRRPRYHATAACTDWTRAEAGGCACTLPHPFSALRSPEVIVSQTIRPRASSEPAVQSRAMIRAGRTMPGRSRAIASLGSGYCWHRVVDVWRVRSRRDYQICSKGVVKPQNFSACGGLWPPAAPAAGPYGRFRVPPALSPPSTPVAKRGAVSCNLGKKCDLATSYNIKHHR